MYADDFELIKNGELFCEFSQSDTSEIFPIWQGAKLEGRDQLSQGIYWDFAASAESMWVPTRTTWKYDIVAVNKTN